MWVFYKKFPVYLGVCSKKQVIFRTFSKIPYFPSVYFLRDEYLYIWSSNGKPTNAPESRWFT